MIIDSCLIIKNEDSNIGELVHQLHMFSNEIHITDTGSTDNTLNILKELQKEYNNLFIHYYEWDKNFSNARNYSLTCYDCKADYQFWCDGDDLLNDKLIESLQEFSTNDSYNDDIYYIKYQYYNDDPNPHVRTSLLKKSAELKWNDPIHEYIGLRTDLKLNFTVFDNGSLIIHNRENKDIVDNGHRNLDIFYNMEKINAKFTIRNLYYYGVELITAGLTATAISKFHECIDDSSVCYEQIYALKRLYEINDPKFLEYSFKLLQKHICRRDIFLYMGNYEFHNNHYEMAKTYYKTCVDFPSPRNEFENFTYYVNCDIDALLQLGLIAFKEGHSDKALEYNNKILEIDPLNEVAISNIDILMNNK